MDKKVPDPVLSKTWKLLKRSDGIPVLNISIRRPSFIEQEKTARVERYFSQLFQYWQNRWETILFPEACQALNRSKAKHSDFIPWQASLDYTVTYWKPPLVSLRIEAIETGRSPQPLHIHQGETWDLQIGYPRTLRSFFPINAKQWRKSLLNIVKAQAEEQLASGESLLDPHCTDIMERSFDPDRFYLTEEGIALFYPLYVLGAYAEGIPTFHVPFSKEN